MNCCIHVYYDVCSWWLYNMLKIINCITHVMIILGPCRNNTFFWVTQISVACAHAVHVLCTHVAFPQEWNNKSDWCWQRWLCNWVTQLMKLQGMLVTGVRFIFNKFPPSNIVVRRFHTLRSHRIFSIGEDNPHVGKALDRWWEALTSVGIFPFGWQKEMSK